MHLTIAIHILVEIRCQFPGLFLFVLPFPSFLILLLNDFPQLITPSLKLIHLFPEPFPFILSFL
jgi:hypothetical protein